MNLSISETHIDALWVRMSKMFGSKFTSQYGDEDDGTWLRYLQGVTPAQINKALEIISDSNMEWPPTHSQFKALCKKSRPPHLRPEANQPALPAPKPSYDHARPYIQTLRAACNPRKKEVDDDTASE